MQQPLQSQYGSIDDRVYATNRVTPPGSECTPASVGGTAAVAAAAASKDSAYFVVRKCEAARICSRGSSGWNSMPRVISTRGRFAAV